MFTLSFSDKKYSFSFHFSRSSLSRGEVPLLFAAQKSLQNHSFSAVKGATFHLNNNSFEPQKCWVGKARSSRSIFMGKAKSERGHLRWSGKGEHLKERGKVLTLFRLIEKKEKAEKGKSRGRLIVFIRWSKEKNKARNWIMTELKKTKKGTFSTLFTSIFGVHLGVFRT